MNRNEFEYWLKEWLHNCIRDNPHLFKSGDIAEDAEFNAEELMKELWEQMQLPELTSFEQTMINRRLQAILRRLNQNCPGHL